MVSATHYERWFYCVSLNVETLGVIDFDTARFTVFDRSGFEKNKEWRLKTRGRFFCLDPEHPRCSIESIGGASYVFNGNQLASSGFYPFFRGTSKYVAKNSTPRRFYNNAL